MWEEDDENMKTVGASGLSNMWPTEPYNMASPQFDIYKVFTFTVSEHNSIHCCGILKTFLLDRDLSSYSTECYV